jgi:hypothetical protein
MMTVSESAAELQKRRNLNNDASVKLDILYLLILKYLSETPPYSLRDASGIITEVNIEAIQKLLADREKLKKEILGYISLDDKLKKMSEENAKMIDGSYDKYNSIFYIQLTAGGNFIIYYLNAEKWCLNVNTRTFFKQHTNFTERMTSVLETITPEEILGIKSFNENYRILFNKMDKIKKGSTRTRLGRFCFVQEKQPYYKNILNVLSKIKEPYTTVGGRKSKKRKTYKRKTYKRKTYKRKTYKRKTYKRKTYKRKTYKRKKNRT